MSTKSSSLLVDDGVEIPIFICGVPRYISGVTATTTCTDIIKALIDDEIANSDVAAGSRDLNDYVITERWRNCEQILPGETLIFFHWSAWGVSRNEVKFRLKINRYNKNSAEPYQKIPAVDREREKQDKLKLIYKIYKRILRQSENIENHFLMNPPLSSLSIQKLNINRNSLKSIRETVKSMDEKFQPFGGGILFESTAIGDALEGTNKYCGNSVVDGPSFAIDELNELVESSKRKKLFPKNNDDETLTDELFLTIENICDSGGTTTVVSPGTIADENFYDFDSEQENGGIPKGIDINRNSTTKEMKISCEPTNDELFGDGTCIERDNFESHETPKHRKSDLNIMNRRTSDHKSNENHKFYLKKTRYETIRAEISEKLFDLQKLGKKLETLESKLGLKHKLYRAENEAYTTKRVDLSVEEVQLKISNLSQEILQIEHEIYEVRMKIDFNQRKLDHLKDMMKQERLVMRNKKNIYMYI